MSCTKGETPVLIGSLKLHVSLVGASLINGLVIIREQHSILYLFESTKGMMIACHLYNCTCLEIRLKLLVINGFLHSFSIYSSNTFLKIPAIPNKVVVSNSAMLTLIIINYESWSSP